MKQLLQRNSEWLTIWLAPRATMRRILDTNPTRHVYWLAMVGGIAQALDQASARSFGDLLSGPVLPFVILGMGILTGFFLLYVASPIMRWTGSWMGSTATTTDVRAALAWSQVPLIAAMVLWIPELLLWGMEWFTKVTPRMDAVFETEPIEGLLLLGFGVVEFVVAVWALIIAIKCLAEAERFSAWKVIGQWLLTILVFVIPVLIVGAFIVYIVQTL